MKIEKKIVTKYGNSKIINVPNLEINEEVYILDLEMLNLIRGIQN
jgi:putative transposon-encoded protein